MRAILLTIVFVACGGAPQASVGQSDVPRGAPKKPLPPIEFEDPTPAVVGPVKQCSDTGEGFEAWLVAFRERAIENGIPRALAMRALDGVQWDSNVVELDRTQHPHQATFETFAEKHITPARVKRGRRKLVEHADLLARIESRWGVAPEILVALWGLETDYGAYLGRTRSLQALATLAYDCRRSELFLGELSSALRILKRGDLSPDDMVGAWAGELGQTQFLPSSYEGFGVDFDGDGRIDLIASKEDALASTANYLASHGWRAHEGYAAGSPNFGTLETWNKSEVYRKTVVLLASKLTARK